MNINVELSIGEFFDKMTILEIKQQRITDLAKLENINIEHAYLAGLLDDLPFSRADVENEVGELKSVNEELWVIEDEIREKERSKIFDEGFIKLARSVYITNDRRAEIKRAINVKLGSDFVEEKSYAKYQ